MAVETSAFLMAKVPPNPQHWSLSGSSMRSRPFTALSRRCGRSPIFSERREWQEVWSVTRMREGGADVGDSELVYQQFGEFVDARQQVGDFLFEARQFGHLGK